MDIIKDIPAQTGIIHRIQSITFDIVNKVAHCHVEISAMDGVSMKNVTIDVMPIIQAATDPQKAVVRGFFKQVIAEAVQVALADVPDTVFT